MASKIEGKAKVILYECNSTFEGYEQNVYHFSSEMVEIDSQLYVLDKVWLLWLKHCLNWRET